MTSKIATKTKQIFGKKPTQRNTQTFHPSPENFIKAFKKSRKLEDGEEEK
ncbi:hypothetical protein [Methylobacter sp. YRD-M1]|nr:hypothetical protein [Methylobacter sp. YRD-M1]WAK01849.1 hypothetical protein LZ558_18850 [Methylobacter sp. YRD-M1]